AVRDTDPKHEVAGRVLAEEQPVPLHPDLVVVGDRFPTIPRVAFDVGQDVEPILRGLDLLELVHAPLPVSDGRTAAQTDLSIWTGLPGGIPFAPLSIASAVSRRL